MTCVLDIFFVFRYPFKDSSEEMHMNSYLNHLVYHNKRSWSQKYLHVPIKDFFL